MFSSKTNIKYSKKWTKTKCVCFIEILWLNNENEAEKETWII